MKNTLLLLCFLFTAGNLFAQINMGDSTVQVIASWDNHESRIYTFTSEKIEWEDNEITSEEIINYDLEIVVKDSTENGYLVEWIYSNLHTKGMGKIEETILSRAKSVNVIYKINTWGEFVELVNWEEIQQAMLNAIEEIKTEFNMYYADIDRLIREYSSKENIQDKFPEIPFYHRFFGQKYKLGEVYEGSTQMRKVDGLSKAYDAHYTMGLTEIYEEDNEYRISYNQKVNNDQVMDVILTTINDMEATGSTFDEKDRNVLYDIINNSVNESAATFIIQESGWISYLKSEKTIKAANRLAISKEVLELK